MRHGVKLDSGKGFRAADEDGRMVEKFLSPNRNMSSKKEMRIFRLVSLYSAEDKEIFLLLSFSRDLQNQPLNNRPSSSKGEYQVISDNLATISNHTFNTRRSREDREYYLIRLKGALSMLA